jgi:hypothetical protein
MSDGQIEEQGEQLRKQVEIERTQAGGVRQWRCSEVLRGRVVAYAATCSAEGESHRRISLRLGLDQATLSRWIRRSTASSSDFRRVAIVPTESSELRPSVSSLRLRTPHGFIVEGLDLERLAALLRALE